VRRHVDLPGRIVGSEPERGDIVVFKFPPDNKTDYIKRLIGLPGDRIQMVDGILYINGNPVPKVRVEDYVETNEYGTVRTVPQYRETLPNGVSYNVLDRANTIADNTGVYVVPAGHYFMMGDNRDDSNDSRADVGMVPFENLVGRARFIWWSVDESIRLFDPTTWFSAIRYDRIATVVD
jgi:signal peptidase I